MFKELGILHGDVEELILNYPDIVKQKKNKSC
jgi:hypothetical protein